MRALILALTASSLAAWSGEPACVFTGTGENLPAGQLHVRGLRSPFAETTPFKYHHEVTLWLREGAWAQRTPVLIETGHVRLALELAPAELPSLVLRKPLRFGVFTAAAAQRVRVVNRAGPRVTVEMNPPAGFKPRGELSTQASCDVLGLAWPERNEEAQPAGPTLIIAAGREFPISASPSAPDEGTIALSEETDATLLSQRGESVRVRWSVDEGTFEGWIPLSVTRPTDGGYGSGVGWLRGKQGREVDVIDDTTTQCLQDVTLSVRLDDEVAPLGRLLARTPFHVGKLDAAGAHIALGLDGLALRAGAELILSPAAWRDCR